MSLPHKQECGIEFSAWNASGHAAGVPIKKRRFLFTRSPSPPPSHSTPICASNGDSQVEDATSLSLESFSSVVSANLPDAGSSSFKDSSFGDSTKNVYGTQVSVAQNHSLSFSVGTTSSVTAASAESGNGGERVSENGCTVMPIMGNIPETKELRSAPMDGSFGNKLILSNKSAFQRVLANTELPFPLNRQPEPSLSEPPSLVSFAKEEEPNPCKLNLSLSEAHPCFLSKNTDQELVPNLDSQCNSRSNWDLNTTMDRWEIPLFGETSVSGTTLDNREDGDGGVSLGSVHLKKTETEQSKNCEDPPDHNIMKGKHELSENTCNLGLPNTLNSSSGKYGIHADLNLQLNMDSVSMPFSSVSVSTASPTPLLKTSVLSLCAVGPTSSHVKFPCGDVKTELVEDGENGKYTGASCFKASNHEFVKSEVLDSDQDSFNSTCINAVKTVSGGFVKLEQLDAPCLEGPGKLETKAHDGIAQETAKTGEVHIQSNKGNAAWSLDLAPQNIAGSNNLPDTLITPATDGSPILNHASELAPVNVVKASISNENKMDLSHSVPSSKQPSGASLIFDNSVALESIGSEVNSSHDALFMCMHVVQQDDEENTTKASEVASESSVMMCKELSPVEVTYKDLVSTSNEHVGSGNEGAYKDLVSSSNEHVGSGNEEHDANCLQGSNNQFPHSDHEELPAFVSMDMHDLHTCDDNKLTENNIKNETSEPSLCKNENEPCSSHEVIIDKERVHKHHSDDEDYEDGEFRESVLCHAIKGSAREKKDASLKEGDKSDAPLVMSLPTLEHEIELQNRDVTKDVHHTVEAEILCYEKTEDGLNLVDDIKESAAIDKLITEASRKKPSKISRKMPQDSGKESSGAKATHKKPNSSNKEKCLEKVDADFGNQPPKAPADQPSPSRTSASRSCDATKCVKAKSDRSHIKWMSSPVHAYSGRIKASNRLSSRSDREHIKDESIRREKISVKSSRDDTHIHRMHRSEKEKDLDQVLRKSGSDRRVHMRGRIVQQFKSIRGNWDPDHGYASEHFNMSTTSQYSRPKNASEAAFTVAMDVVFGSPGRTGKKHVDDELCRPPPRRPSPGGSGSLPAGVQMTRRTMRDISPGRCTEEGIPDHAMPNREGKLMRGFADDMVNSPMLMRRPNYEPGRNCLIRRERSISPFQRRGATRISNISFASSTRPRPHSPHMWSPSRRPEVFDGHPDLIHYRSSDVRVERMRSPGERACFQDNMLSRRHLSPHMVQLHGDMPDNLMRGHDLPKISRPPQGNRRFDLIDHRVNSENFGQFHGIDGDNVYAEERRSSEEGHALARPFRQQHYVVGDDVASDGGFHHRIEDIPPRPIRLRQDTDEEYPGRGISRIGSIRNRLGNVHNRRLRGMNEQEDDYRQDDGQAWHGANVRLKRRRF